MKTFLSKYSLVIYVALLALVALGIILYANTDDATYLILSAIFFWIGANFKWIGTISVLEGNAKKFQIIICAIFNLLMVSFANQIYTEFSPYLN